MENNVKFGRFIKIGLVLLLVVVPVAVVFGLDGGDTCADAVPITSLPFADTGDTTPNTNTLSSYSGTCTLPFSYAGEDQIYEITVGPGNMMDFSMDLTGSTGDLALFIISDCGDGTSCVVNSQDAIGPGAGPEVINNVSLPTGTHYLYIDSYYDAGTPGSAGTFSLDITGTLGDVSQPGIALTKTVGTTAGVCATTNSISVPLSGADVYYCYEVANTGDVTLTLHDLVDDQHGALLTGFNYPLGPGDSVDTVAAGLTVSATVGPVSTTTVITNTAVWTATNANQNSASATASASVSLDGPTSVSLTGFGEGGVSATPIWLGALVLLVAGLGLVMRRRFTD